MVALLCFFLTLFASPFKSKSRLEAENAALRHQLIVLRRKVRGRVQLTNGDRLFLVQLYRWFPSVLKAITIIRPETLVRWHRAGFRRYWRWKSRSLGGRPQIDADLRALIRRMSVDNPLWGAPRIHGELLKLGFEVAQSSVAKYMVKRCGPPSPRDGAPSCVTMRRTSPPWVCSSSGEKIIMPNRRGDRVLGPTLDPTKKTPRRARAKACWDSGLNEAAGAAVEGSRSTRFLSERIVGVKAQPFRQEVFRWLRSALFAAA